MIKILQLSFFMALSMNVFSQQNSNWCGTDKILQDLKNSNPNFAESLHQSMLKAANGTKGHGGSFEKSLLSLPVVVHIIHDNGIGNISDTQVQSALDILNQDYNRLNPDTSATRNTANAPFKPEAGSMNIVFKLAKIDPNGACTNGIVRVNAPNLTYNTDDACKYSSNGGSDQWPMDKYINIWVVNSINSSGAVGTILGYAYLPYWPSGTDYGILIRHDTFGVIETANNSDGRTLTHEMGHLLGLQHIFDQGNGATGCHSNDCNSNGDYCCDTPPQQEANWSCSPTWNSCPEIPVNDPYGADVVDQIENYMSYNYCQNMFSRDQAAIMQQNFVDINFMASMVTPQNSVATGINDPTILCKAEFETYKNEVCFGDSVQFIDRSFHNPTAWTWTVTPGIENTDWAFAGGTNLNSQNPIIQFFTEGLYQIALTATDGVYTDSEVKAQYIKVLPFSKTIPYWEGFEGISTLVNSTDWTVTNFQNNNTFQVETAFGNSGNQSVELINFGQGGSNRDELISSPIDLGVLDPATDNVTLSFRYAYRKRNSTNDEWLKVFIMNNCADTWVQRKTLHGDFLSPIAISNSWQPTQNDWVTVHMTNVTTDYFVNNFRFKFQFDGNGGNNLYLDDINLYQGAPSNGIVLGLAEEGELNEISLFPNPAEDEINLRFATATNQETLIQIQDISGKITQSHLIHAVAGANSVQLVTNQLAAGVYFVSINAGGVQKTIQFVKK